MKKSEVTLSKATVKDAAAIHALQLEAFMPLLEKYQDYETNPANETLERLVERMNQEFVNYYIIRNAGNAVGSIRVKKIEEHHYWLGQLCVVPQSQGQGIAQQAFARIEEIYSDAKMWGWRPSSRKSGTAICMRSWATEGPMKSGKSMIR